MNRTARLLAALALLLALPAGGAMAGAVNGFTPGAYRITPVDPDSRATEKPQTLCAADANALLRFRHGGSAMCQDQLVQPEKDRTTVTYSCAADGWGRTELRREIPGLYQIDTQGIANRQPFALRAEARLVGECPAPVHSARR
jgi:hypothetical protein